jgi:hypothetical protein
VLNFVKNLLMLAGVGNTDKFSHIFVRGLPLPSDLMSECIDYPLHQLAKGRYWITTSRDNCKIAPVANEDFLLQYRTSNN